MTSITLAEEPASPSKEASRKRGRIFLFAGALVFATGVWGLSKDVAWIAQPFYMYGWWGYILMLDGFVALKRGQSLFTTRRKHVLPILIWSVSFWFFFELLNLRFQNWYYVGAFKLESVTDLLWAGTFTVVCFATVFTGIFETYDALTAAELFRKWKGASGKLPFWVSYAVQGLGVLMVVVSLVFPYYLAPLVWGSLTFIVDPWNYRAGARSLLRDAEHRDFGLVSRVLLAGLVCGLVWESLNFFAPQKWIYTVRGLEELKLFEMPLLGFLGFPALALDAFAMYSFLAYWFHGNQTWESPEDLPYRLEPRQALSRKAFLMLLPLHVVFWVVVSVLLNQVNVGSVEVELSDLKTLSESARRTLAEEGIERPLQLLGATRDPLASAALRARLRYTQERFQRLLEETELYMFKGIGADNGILLKKAGIARVEQLKDRDPETLHREVSRHAEDAGLPAPRLGMVHVWVLAARRDDSLLP